MSPATEPARTLSERGLNRAVLARQLLLDRSALSIPKALERIGGIQAQYAPSMYVGLWSRLRGFERPALERALEGRRVVQGTSLRATIHLLTPRDWWRFATAIGERRREEWLRYHKGGPTAREVTAAARRVDAALADGPLERKRVQELAGLGAPGVTALNVWLDLVRLPPSGTWERRRADLFGDAEQWIGERPRLEPAAATIELVRSYLRGFGPSTVAEIADWAGLANAPIRTALSSIELRRFRAEDGAELVDLPRLALPDPETPAPARFLPVWDATTLAHVRRAAILPEQHRAKVFNTKTPQSAPTFLVDGEVAGTWRFEHGRVELQPFTGLSAAARRELEAEAEGLARLHA